MKILTVTTEGNIYKINSQDKFYSEIIFTNATDATLKLDDKIYETTQDESKNIILSENGKSLFTFKFDKLWGGAEIISSGTQTGLKIKGKWFKIGTRLIDENHNDLIEIVNSKNGFDVNLIENNMEPLMIISTVYYHIYASNGKLLSQII